MNKWAFWDFEEEPKLHGLDLGLGNDEYVPGLSVANEGMFSGLFQEMKRREDEQAQLAAQNVGGLMGQGLQAMPKLGGGLRDVAGDVWDAGKKLFSPNDEAWQIDGPGLGGMLNAEAYPGAESVQRGVGNAFAAAAPYIAPFDGNIENQGGPLMPGPVTDWGDVSAEDILRFVGEGAVPGKAWEIPLFAAPAGARLGAGLEAGENPAVAALRALQDAAFMAPSPADPLPAVPAVRRSVTEVPQFAPEARALAGQAGQTVTPRGIDTAPLGVRLAGAADEVPAGAADEAISASVPAARTQAAEAGPSQLDYLRVPENVTEARPLPPQRRLPETGQYAAIVTDDGSIYFDPVTSGGRTHIDLIRDQKIPPERIVRGAWLKDGVVGDAQGGAAEIGRRARAQLSVNAKVNAANKTGAQGAPINSGVQQQVVGPSRSSSPPPAAPPGQKTRPDRPLFNVVDRYARNPDSVSLSELQRAAEAANVRSPVVPGVPMDEKERLWRGLRDEYARPPAKAPLSARGSSIADFMQSRKAERVTRPEPVPGMEDWGYSLKKLEAARKQGPDAFQAEKTRQRQIIQQRQAEQMKINRANAQQRYGYRGQEALDESRSAMQDAATRARAGENTLKWPGEPNMGGGTGTSYQAGLPQPSGQLRMKDILEHSDFKPTPLGDIAREWGKKVLDNPVEEIGNTMRQAAAGADFSYALRQGGLTLRHGREYLNSLHSAFKALGDEAYALNRMEELRATPRSKLFLSALPGEKAAGRSLTAREENYASDLIGNLPIYKETGRANVMLLNEQRAAIYDTVTDAWKRSGNKLARPGDDEALANYINRLTGRGTLGKWDEGSLSNVLGLGFFSPRYLASRPQAFMNLFNVQHPRVAIEAWKDFGAYTAATAALLGLANESGVADVSLDPSSSDFGKARMGKVTVDPWLGFQQIARFGSRVGTGAWDGDQGEVTRELERFLRTKLAPLPSATYSLLAKDGKDLVGEDVTPESLAIGLTPIFVQGMIEAAIDGDKSGLVKENLPAAALDFVGLSTQVYENIGLRRDDLSSQLFDAKYDELSPMRQAEVNAKLASSGVEFDAQQRLAPWWSARDAALEIVGESNPIVRRFKDYNGWRDFWYSEFKNEGIPEAEWSNELNKVNRNAGLDEQIADIRMMLVLNDPEVAKALEQQKIVVPKYIKDALEKVPAR